MHRVQACGCIVCMCLCLAGGTVVQPGSGIDMGLAGASPFPSFRLLLRQEHIRTSSMERVKIHKIENAKRGKRKERQLDSRFPPQIMLQTSSIQ
ncbi:hypothetical protein GGI42DRAFT_190240 [Trichoderma sp. SZMC 28013]